MRGPCYDIEVSFVCLLVLDSLTGVCFSSSEAELSWIPEIEIEKFSLLTSICVILCNIVEAIAPEMPFRNCGRTRRYALMDLNQFGCLRKKKAAIGCDWSWHSGFHVELPAPVSQCDYFHPIISPSNLFHGL